MKTLRGKLMAYFFLAVLLVMGIYGAITYNMVKQDLNLEMENRLIITGMLMLDYVDPKDIPFLELEGRVHDKYIERLAKIKTITGVNDILILNTEKKPVFSMLGKQDRVFVHLDSFETDKAMKGDIVSTPLYKGTGGRYFKTIYIPIEGKNGNAGVLGVEASAVYMKYIRHYSNSLIMAGAIIAAVVFILSMIISRKITYPISLLKEKALEISRRNFDENIEVQGEEEIQVLAGAFDRMKNELKDYIRDREKMAAVGEFSAGIAHEIRNSLNVITGYAELLKEKSGDDNAVKYAGNILVSARKMDMFVNNFLTYTKEFTPEFSSVNIGKLMDALLADIKPEIKKILKCEADGGINEKTIRADDYLLKKALYNIIINGYEALDKKEKKLDVKIKGENSRIFITVRDNGRGIPDSTKEKIFQPFYTEKKEGYGLGLGIAYKIIKEIHGGAIEIKSSKDSGTEFLIILPENSDV
ncbi:MAG: ATP-binding protein [Candidatus Goldiibacteriota bacterium]